MNTVPLTIIELNDSEIRTAKDTEIVSRNPGYAVLKPDRIETGIEAWKIARTNPRETSNQYWSHLNQDSLIIPSRLARHNADLAYTQLIAIHEHAGKPDEVLFAIPGSYNRDQLALLLGIVEACPFSAVGLVDSAVAATSAVADTGEYNHVDIHLHKAIVTTLDVTDQVTRKSVKVIDKVGIAEIYDSCAEYFADLFIDQSRFDPLHHAESEQNLYNQIPVCLADLRVSDETSLDIHYKDKHYQAKVSAESLLERLKQHYEKIYREIAGASMNLISDRLNALPSFTQALKNTTIISEDSVFTGCHLNIESIRSSGPALNFITSLPAAASSATTVLVTQPTQVVASKKPVQPQVPTHILVNNQAYALNSHPLYVSEKGEISDSKTEYSGASIILGNKTAEVRAEGDKALYVNGNQIKTNSPVSMGDAISIAGSEMMIKCIEVVSN